MRRQNQNVFFKGKGFYISLLTGAISMVAIVAVCLNIFSEEPSENLPDLNEPAKVEEDHSKDLSFADMDQENPLENDVVEPNDDSVVDAPTDAELERASLQAESDVVKAEAAKVEAAKVEKEAETKVADESKKDGEEETVEVMGKKNKVSKLKFNQEDGLLWPVEGNVILNYSMSNSIYFQTLCQYKCNPAVVIAGKVGTEVLSATNGIVTAIGKSDEIGNTITTSIGNDYTVIYGQLDNVTVKVGDKLKEGDVLGKIAKPTKYYVVEGSNLYLKVMQKEETVNPMLLLR